MKAKAQHGEGPQSTATQRTKARGTHGDVLRYGAEVRLRAELS